MIIRKAEIGDLPRLAGLLDQYRVFYKQTPDLEATTSFLQERFIKGESVIFLAVENDLITGFAQLYPLFSSVRLKRVWLLNDLFVQQEARKKGVAAALLTAAADFGKETGSKFLLLQTAADNFTAQSVYEKNGWKKIDDFFYELML